MLSEAHVPFVRGNPACAGIKWQNLRHEVSPYEAKLVRVDGSVWINIKNQISGSATQS